MKIPETEQAITVRPVTPADEAFLRSLYASTREDEMALLAWEKAEQDAFLAMQFQAQHAYYQEHFGAAEFFIITQDTTPIGRLYLDRRDDEIRIIDIALLPAHRNRGIGTAFLNAILAEGQESGLPVRIHVEHNNPALRLYNRLGFKKVTENGIYFLMEKPPVRRAGG